MQLDDPTEALAREWMEKALHDLLTAQAVITRQELHDVVAFHCQQAMEKALKAFLTWQKVPFRRAHDLTALLSQCEAQDSAFAQPVPEATMLERYAVTPRYPGPYSIPSPSETHAALAASERAFLFVTRLLPSGARS